MEFNQLREFGPHLIPVGLITKPMAPPLELSVPLTKEALESNIYLTLADTPEFTEFALAHKHIVSFTVRAVAPRIDDSSEAILTLAFLRAEKIYETHGTIDPRISYCFADVLMRLDNYNYPIDILKKLVAQLPVASPYLMDTIAYVERLREAKMLESRQSLRSLFFWLCYQQLTRATYKDSSRP